MGLRHSFAAPLRSLRVLPAQEAEMVGRIDARTGNAMKMLRLTLCSMLLLGACQQACATTTASGRQKQGDALFARWNRADTPGAAVGVIKDGEVVYRRAFGMADIEQDRPITPSTIFHVASLSK